MNIRLALCAVFAMQGMLFASQENKDAQQEIKKLRQEIKVTWAEKYVKHPFVHVLGDENKHYIHISSESISLMRDNKVVGSVSLVRIPPSTGEKLSEYETVPAWLDRTTLSSFEICEITGFNDKNRSVFIMLIQSKGKYYYLVKEVFYSLQDRQYIHYGSFDFDLPCKNSSLHGAQAELPGVIKYIRQIESCRLINSPHGEKCSLFSKYA